MKNEFGRLSSAAQGRPNPRKRISMSARAKRICVDVGGTFTDCLVMDEAGLLQKFKTSTTPSDPTLGFMEAMRKAARHYGASVEEFLGQVEMLVHGTTLATNI